jgi:hypothetical protein
MIKRGKGSGVSFSYESPKEKKSERPKKRFEIQTQNPKREINTNNFNILKNRNLEFKPKMKNMEILTQIKTMNSTDGESWRSKTP